MGVGASHKRLLLTTTMLVSALAGYGRRAYGACTPNPSPKFECTDNASVNTATQSISVDNAEVVTLPFFGVDTTDGIAVTITGDGALSYTDDDNSSLTAASIALHVYGAGDSGGTPGSITIKTTGKLTGGFYGIYAFNSGSGVVDVTANGDVVGLTGGVGIFAKNFGGTDLAVTTGVGTKVSGATGILVDNYSNIARALKVTANGDVYGTSGPGIDARNYGTSLTVITGVDSYVKGSTDGIVARNHGSEALEITANGDVTGTDGTGIYASNANTDLKVSTLGLATTITGGDYGIVARNSGKNLIVTTGTGTKTIGGTFGIHAINFGTEALTVTANGNVTGTYSTGIYAKTYGMGLTVTTGPGTTVTGGGYGIVARHYDGGALDITANGNVTGTDAYGILAISQGDDLTVTTAAGTTVTGGTGINAVNFGSGPLDIVANGNVTGTNGDGIYTYRFSGPIDIMVGSTGHVKSTGVGAGDFAIETGGTGASITVAGMVTGGAGGAIAFDQCLCANDRLELHPTAVITGLVLGGPGIDSFVLGGTGTESFDVGDIGPGQQYQSFERFLKEDASKWELTGTNNAGISSWTVNGGLLSVNATMPNTTFFVNGGTLGGTGTIGNLFANAGGTVAPGNSIGTLNVANVTFDPGSFYEVEIDDAGNSDLIDATGIATLNGGTVNVLALPGTYVANTQYTIITTGGGRTGTFAGATDNLAFLDAVLSYDAFNVYLNLMLNSTSFTDIAQTPNQQAVAGALDSLPLSDPVVAALLGQTNAGALQAFDALSGEVHASLAGMLIDESHFLRNSIFARLLQAFYGGGGAANVAALGASGPTLAALGGAPMMGPMMGLGMGSGGKAAPAPNSTGLAFWTQGFGSWGNFKSDGNAASADRTLGGFVSGVDAGLGGGWRAGFAGGYTQTSASVDARSSAADIESYHLATYAGGGLGPLALRSGAAWTWHEIETSRAIVFPGFFQQADASYDGDTGQLFGELALPLGAGGTAVESFGRLAYVHVSTGGFTESGGIAALTASEIDDNVTYSMLGLRAATTMFIDGMHVTPHASAAWQHAFGDVTTDMALAFAGSGAGFVISGVPIARNSAFLEAGLDFKIAPDATLGISYQGQIADGVQDHGLSGRLDWRF